MATTFLTPQYTVTVNGFARRTRSGSTSCGFRASFATASIQFAPGEAGAVPGDKIVVWLGYRERGGQIVFTGEADDDTLAYWPQAPGVQATGFLGRLQRALGTEMALAPADPETGEKPAYYAQLVTDEEIARHLLDLYGCPVGDIQAMTPATVFGTIRAIALAKDTPGWSLLQDLDRLTFMRTFDAPDGTVRRLPINGLPGNVAYTLTEGASILAGSRTRSRRGVINKVTMTGQADAGGPGVAPKATRQADSPYIPTPPQYQAEGWQSELAETEELCDYYCLNRLGQTNRLAETVSVTLPFCRPEIAPATTLAIDAAHFGYDATTVFWVEQVEHSWSPTGMGTTLGLVAATAGAGVNPNLAPVALLHVTIEHETIAGVPTWIAYADGAASFDPDGVALDLDPQHGIATYLWSGTPTGPATPAGLPRATYAYTSDPTGATITLVVRDTSLKAGTAQHVITAPEVANAARRDLWAAAETELWLTTDGGAAWQPVGVPAMVIAEMAHPDYQLAASLAGALYRITLSAAGAFAVTPIATPSNVTALHINLGPDGTGTHRCWAGGNGGETWLSTDDGQTWAARGTIPNVAGASGPAVKHIEESPFAFGTLYALSGPAMWVSFDEGVTWASVRAYPDVALTAQRFASGRFADIAGDKSYHWAAWAGTSANIEQRLLEQDDLVEVDVPVAARPAQFAGLTMGAFAPELYLADQSGGGKTWHIANFQSGGELVQTAYDAAYGLPHHLIRDPDFDGIVYGAADDAFFKSYDKLQHVAPILTLAGGMTGRMIGYGRLHAPLVVVVVGHLTALAIPATGPYAGTVRLVRATGGTPAWVDLGPVGMTGPLQANSKTRLVKAGAGHYFAYSAYTFAGGGAALGRQGELWETTNDGASWTSIPEADHLMAFALCDDGSYYFVVATTASGGTIYGRGPAQIVYHDGTGFHNRATYQADDNAGFTHNTGIAADPTNPLNVAYQTHAGVNLSVDGGATFPAVVTGSPTVSTNSPENVVAGTAGRVISVPYNGATNTASPASTPWPGGPLTVVTATTIASQNIQFLRAPSGNLYLVGNAKVIQSTDNGASWNDLPIPTSTPFGVVELDTAGAGVFGLAAQYNGDGSGPNPWRTAWYAQDAAGAWSDLTAQQVADLGTLYVPVRGGVAG